MSPFKLAAIVAVSPLENAGILLHVLNILGPGHHLFISAVSKACRETYKRVDNVQIARINCSYYIAADKSTVTSKMTLYSAVFSSASRVRLAHEDGLMFEDRFNFLHRVAGKAADVPTLQAAHELGLAFTAEVLIGAAEDASLPKLHWLHMYQGCGLPPLLNNFAARSGSIDTLRWTHDHGIPFTPATCESAAACAHVHVLRFLRDEGCE
jgi:hypothetical protein